MTRGTLILSGLLLATSSVLAQTMVPTSREPQNTQHFYAPKKSMTRVKKPTIRHTARYEFYERVEKAAREKKKVLRKLSKAQYSDFRYFGHKQIPTRRPFFRMRYCQECGIRH